MSKAFITSAIADYLVSLGLPQEAFDFKDL